MAKTFTPPHLQNVPPAYREIWRARADAPDSETLASDELYRPSNSSISRILQLIGRLLSAILCALLRSSWRGPGRFVGAHAQGRRTGRCHRPLSARRSAHSPTSRSSWSRISPTKPSSPSRTRACSTSCANPCNSRPPPPTCSRSSAARRSISQTVLDTLVESAARLCAADMAGILRPNAEVLSIFGQLRLYVRVPSVHGEVPATDWTGLRRRSHGAGRQACSNHGRVGRSGIHLDRGCKDRRNSHDVGRPADAGRDAYRRDHLAT